MMHNAFYLQLSCFCEKDGIVAHNGKVTSKDKSRYGRRYDIIIILIIEAKHSRNEEACAFREWSCIPLVVEVFGGWGNEAIIVLSNLSKTMATQLCRPLSEVTLPLGVFHIIWDK